MRSGPKRKLKAVDALAREATKVGLGDCEDARALRSAARAARAWFAKVKRTGIERGEASISELRALLPEAAKIRVDISGDVDVVKQAQVASLFLCHASPWTARCCNVNRVRCNFMLDVWAGAGRI